MLNSTTSSLHVLQKFHALGNGLGDKAAITPNMVDMNHWKPTISSDVVRLSLAWYRKGSMTAKYWSAAISRTANTAAMQKKAEAPSAKAHKASLGDQSFAWSTTSSGPSKVAQARLPNSRFITNLWTKKRFINKHVRYIIFSIIFDIDQSERCAFR